MTLGPRRLVDDVTFSAAWVGSCVSARGSTLMSEASLNLLQRKRLDGFRFKHCATCITFVLLFIIWFMLASRYSLACFDVFFHM